MTTPKDPQVLNDGVNDAFIFLEVTVPYRDNIVIVNDDGTKNAAATEELFDYTINDGWVEVGTPVTDADNGVVKHVYAYVGDNATDLKPLTAGETTPTLFDEITFVNVVENQGFENSELDVVINAYGIQTEGINGGKTDPQGVWEVITKSQIGNTPNTPIDPNACPSCGGSNFDKEAERCLDCKHGCEVLLVYFDSFSPDLVVSEPYTVISKMYDPSHPFVYEASDMITAPGCVADAWLEYSGDSLEIDHFEFKDFATINLGDEPQIIWQYDGEECWGVVVIIQQHGGNACPSCGSYNYNQEDDFCNVCKRGWTVGLLYFESVDALMDGPYEVIEKSYDPSNPFVYEASDMIAMPGHGADSWLEYGGDSLEIDDVKFEDFTPIVLGEEPNIRWNEDECWGSVIIIVQQHGEFYLEYPDGTQETIAIYDPDMTFGDYFEDREGWTVAEWFIRFDERNWLIVDGYISSGAHLTVYPSVKPVAGKTYILREPIPI
jgi:hypothetical protein